eukprot:207602_1
MTQYQHIITMFGGVGTLLFLIWLSLVIRELLTSKWNRFCRYMAISKFESFILPTSIDDFISQCDRMLNEEKTMRSDFPQDTTAIYNSKEEDIDFKDLVATCVQSVLIIVVSFPVVHPDQLTYCSHSSSVINIYNAVINSVIICSCIMTAIVACLWSGGWKRVDWIESVNYYLWIKGMMFALFSSQIIVYFYMVSFYENAPCHVHIVWILILLGTIIIPVNIWIAILSVCVLACYFIYQYLGWVVLLVASLSVLFAIVT